jgi:hypothetical protein
MEAINMEASISTILYKDRIEAGGIWEEGTWISQSSEHLYTLACVRVCVCVLRVWVSEREREIQFNSIYFIHGSLYMIWDKSNNFHI